MRFLSANASVLHAPVGRINVHAFEQARANLRRFALVTMLSASTPVAVAGPPLRWVVANNTINATHHHAAPTFTAEQAHYFQHLSHWDLRLWEEFVSDRE